MHQRMTRVIALAAVLLTAFPAFAQSQRDRHWVATWATALVGRPLTTPAPAPQPAATQAPQQAGARPAGSPPLLTFNNQTLRQIVRTSVGGDRVRVVLSNAFGTGLLVVGPRTSRFATRTAQSWSGPGVR